MKYLLFILLLFVGRFSIAQKIPKVVLSTTKTRVLYCGIDNPIEVMMEGSPQRKFTVKIDSGTIKKLDQYHYEVTPTKIGRIIFTIIDDRGVKLLEELLMVKAYPPPLLAVGGQINGGMAISKFKVQGGVSQFRDCFNMSEPKSEVTSYTIKVIRNNSSILKLDIKGKAFSDEFRKFFSELNEGDKVLFENIEYECLPCVTKAIAEPISIVLE